MDKKRPQEQYTERDSPQMVAGSPLNADQQEREVIYAKLEMFKLRVSSGKGCTSGRMPVVQGKM